MTFTEQLSAIFSKLGFTTKAKEDKLSKEEWDQVFASYKDEYGTDLATDLQDAERYRASEADRNKIISLLNEDNDDDQTLDVVGRVENLLQENKDLTKKVKKMSQEATDDTPVTILQSDISINGPGNTQTHFLGIEHDTFSMKHRWNQISVNPAYATVNPVDEEEHAAPFHKAVKQFSATFTQRYRYLRENRMLIPEKLAAGEFGLDTTRLPDAGLGDQYMVRRQDALIARILTLRTVTDYFPVRYNVQDREMITNAYFDEISQAYQTGEVWKGDMKLEPEWGHVDDAMVKTLFGPMKEIERKYIGYLNTDGSDPVKWSMIEFALLGLYKNMLNEQNKRRMLGIYVKPEEKKPGSYLNASTGIIYTLIRYYHENRFLLHDDFEYREYDKMDMLGSVQEFVEDIQTTLTEDQDLSGKILYLNYNHQPWWKKNIRRVYGKETDFTGPDSYLNKVPDTDVSIKWLPNLGQLKLMLMQDYGNLQFLENKPGEMFALKMKEDMEEVKGWSTWKEGTSASFIGPKFKNKDLLKENEYLLQQIFMNKFSQDLEPDATTIKADPKKSFWYITAENTQPTVITDILKPKRGTAYIIECGSTVNATEISQSGKFSTITDDWKPTQVEDYIMVVLNSEGKFLELERCVGGVREINPELQPNIPGAR